MRSEINKDFADLRVEIKKDATDLRAEINKDITDLRVDMNQKFGEVNLKASDLPTKTYMWGILGVLITAYGSGLAALAIIR